MSVFVRGLPSSDEYVLERARAVRQTASKWRSAAAHQVGEFCWSKQSGQLAQAPHGSTNSYSTGYAPRLKPFQTFVDRGLQGGAFTAATLEKRDADRLAGVKRQREELEAYGMPAGDGDTKPLPATIQGLPQAGTQLVDNTFVDVADSVATPKTAVADAMTETGLRSAVTDLQASSTEPEATRNLQAVWRIGLQGGFASAGFPLLKLGKTVTSSILERYPALSDLANPLVTMWAVQTELATAGLSRKRRQFVDEKVLEQLPDAPPREQRRIIIRAAAEAATQTENGNDGEFNYGNDGFNDDDMGDNRPDGDVPVVRRVGFPDDDVPVPRQTDNLPLPEPRGSYVEPRNTVGPMLFDSVENQGDDHRDVVAQRDDQPPVVPLTDEQLNEVVQMMASEIGRFIAQHYPAQLGDFDREELVRRMFAEHRGRLTEDRVADVLRDYRARTARYLDRHIFVTPVGNDRHDETAVADEDLQGGPVSGAPDNADFQQQVERPPEDRLLQDEEIEDLARRAANAAMRTPLPGASESRLAKVYEQHLREAQITVNGAEKAYRDILSSHEAAVDTHIPRVASDDRLLTLPEARELASRAVDKVMQVAALQFPDTSFKPNAAEIFFYTFVDIIMENGTTVDGADDEFVRLVEGVIGPLEDDRFEADSERRARSRSDVLPEPAQSVVTPDAAASSASQTQISPASVATTPASAASAASATGVPDDSITAPMQVQDEMEILRTPEQFARMPPIRSKHAFPGPADVDALLEAHKEELLPMPPGQRTKFIRSLFVRKGYEWVTNWTTKKGTWLLFTKNKMATWQS